MAQAVWTLDVENLGPFIVEGDSAGNSLFERENAKMAPHIKALYAESRPPALHRYGETDETEELI